MSQKYLDILSKFLRYILFGGALLYLVVFVVIACLRMNYPYELDWMEGAFVDHVKQILAGKQLYVEPSIEFTPYFYTPLYFYLSALVAKVLGIGFLPLRLVAFLSSIGCFALIFQFVRRETKSVFYGILSAGLFAATFKISGGWYDIARLDTLYLFFIIASVYLLRFGTDVKSIVFAALLMFLAFITKQSALFTATILSVYCFLAYERWSRYVFPITFFLLVGISTAILSWVSDGWYYYYIFDLPRQHRLVKSMILGFWMDDILPFLPIALGVSIFYIIYQFAKNKKDFLFYTLLFIAMVGSSWLSRLHSGSWVNVIFPAYFVVALLFGLGLQRFLSEYFDSAKYIGLFFLIISIFQFLLLSYNPRDYLPNKDDVEAGDAFIRLLAGIDGEIFMSYPGFLPSLAGKNYCSDGGAMGDIFRGNNEELKKQLEADVRKAIRSQRFQAIIVSQPWFGFFINSPSFIEEVEKHYEDKGPIFENKRVFFPVNGGKVGPERLYVLKEQHVDVAEN